MSEQKLYIGNLPYRTTEGDVREYLRNYGPIYSVILIYDSETGRTRGYGFVELEDSAAEAVLRDLNDTKFMGRNFKVRRANVREAMNDDQKNPLRRRLTDPPSKTIAGGGGCGNFGKYGDFNQENFKGLLINGKYYNIQRDNYGMYHAYRFTDSNMNYSGPSNDSPIE